MLRPARVEDLPRLRVIEGAAGIVFRDVDMGAVADDEPPTVEALESYVRNGRAWVATDTTNHPVAYVLVDVVDDAGHVEQVSVDVLPGLVLQSSFRTFALRTFAQHHTAPPSALPPRPAEQSSHATTWTGSAKNARLAGTVGW